MMIDALVDRVITHLDMDNKLDIDVETNPEPHRLVKSRKSFFLQYPAGHSENERRYKVTIEFDDYGEVI